MVRDTNYLVILPREGLIFVTDVSALHSLRLAIEDSHGGKHPRNDHGISPGAQLSGGRL